MNAIQVKGYGAYTTEDDRGSIGHLKSVHETKQAALYAARNIGWYGGKGEVKELDVVMVGDTILVGELILIKPEQCQMDIAKDLRARKEAAQKKLKATLTPDEAKLLELKIDF